MLNHAIDNLTTAQEDVFLTTGMIAFTRFDNVGRRCFLGALDFARDGNDLIEGSHFKFPDGDRQLAIRFNELCQKLEGVLHGQRLPLCFSIRGGAATGAARLGTLIRNRILSNRARRMLQDVPVLVGRSRGTPQ